MTFTDGKPVSLEVLSVIGSIRRFPDVIRSIRRPAK